MPKATQPELFVVDGSNLATEGRSKPSLEQLNEAVMAFLDDRPDAVVTVVVDATFGHRISSKEVDAFDEAVANNELVTPPAGAIGRGDAFVLSIANKAKAGVLSNDSFQEFHGEYDWLFDEGRLIGGKPVPHVGWVFVARAPVRGPKSRRSVRESKDSSKSGDARAAKEQANRRIRPKSGGASAAASDADTDNAGDAADESIETPTESPSGTSTKRRRGGRNRSSGHVAIETVAPDSAGESQSAASGPKDHVNGLMPFLEFVEKHPVGTSCTAEVESYASHGAYARAGDVLIYLPLRLLDDPAPRSAKAALKIGESIAVVIVGFTPDRRSIDAALPHMASASAIADAPADRPARKRPARRSAATSSPATGDQTAVAGDGPGDADKAPAKKAAAKKAPAKKAPAKKAAAKKAPAKKAPAKKAAAKKAPAKQAAARKAPATQQVPAAKKAPAKKAPAKKAPVTKAAAKKAPAKKPPAKKAAVKKAPAKRSAGTATEDAG